MPRCKQLNNYKEAVLWITTIKTSFLSLIISWVASWLEKMVLWEDFSLDFLCRDKRKDESVTEIMSSLPTVCSAPFSIPFPENNKVDDVVLTITVQPDVTLDFAPPPANPDNPFRLDGNQLRAVRVLDYEVLFLYDWSEAPNSYTE